MNKIKILIVDDAVVVRKLLGEVLSSDPDIEVVGTAANGRIALSKINQVNPDLVILDVEMPEMNGLETLAEIRKTRLLLPVIMFSTLTERGAATTLDALALGATDYATKPANVGSVALAMEHIQQDLIPKIKVLCPLNREQRSFSETPSNPLGKNLPQTDKVSKMDEPPQRVDIVAIGVSTGGPNALADIVPGLSSDFPVPIVIVQHMPPFFTRLLAERLSKRSAIPVAEGQPGKILRPGEAWVAPGDYHMVVERKGRDVILQTHQAPPENSCRPAVDPLFRSVAGIYGPHSLALVLTGMGQDGLQGCEHIKNAGGQTLVQDEASSVVWGMPGLVARAGLADSILPLNRMRDEILLRTKKDRS